MEDSGTRLSLASDNGLEIATLQTSPDEINVKALEFTAGGFQTLTVTFKDADEQQVYSDVSTSDLKLPSACVFLH